VPSYGSVPHNYPIAIDIGTRDGLLSSSKALDAAMTGCGSRTATRSTTATTPIT